MSLQWNDKVFGVKEGILRHWPWKSSISSMKITRFTGLTSKPWVLNPASVRSIEQIPFLPIRFFKSHEVQTTFV
jgi:hypothetical protein